MILIISWNMNTFSTCILVNFFIFLQNIFWILVKDMSNFVKMRGFFLFILLLINCTVSKGQIYKYIGLEDGLNNQKIYHIQKDRRGYMWFLTQEGIDRYDGKHIKHYNFSDDNMTLDSRIALNWLYMDNENVLWVIGQKGRIFIWFATWQVWTGLCASGADQE